MSTVGRHADRLNAITEQIIGAAMEVHSVLGPGLLESAYDAGSVFELRGRGLPVEQQKPLPIRYKEVKLDCVYRLDLVVADCVIVEIKAVEKLSSVPEAQLLSYLKLADFRVGLAPELS